MSVSNEKKSAPWLGRGLGLGWLGVRLVSDYLSYYLQEPFLTAKQRAVKRRQKQNQAAQKLCATLKQMKGPLMKVGQILSMQDQWLPPEAIAELATLQAQAPAMHPTLARARFKAALGKAPEDVFESFDPEPFAAASLGQAHRARTRQGETVVVKIQYPAMADTIQADFKLLRSALRTGRLGAYLPMEVIDELEQGIMAETDYVHEAAQIEFFRRRLQPLAFVRLPKVYPEYSCSRVITLSFVEGKSLDELLKANPSPEVCALIGKHLFQLFLFQIHRVQAFHADPHPGNYRFSMDGSIGLIDFGCVKYLTPEFKELIQAFLRRDWQPGPAAEQRLARLIWGPGPQHKSPAARSVVRTEIALFNLVFPPPENGPCAVSFENTKLFELGLKVRQECLQAKLAQREFPFYSRSELGLYSYLRKLQARLDTNAILREVLRG